MGSMWLRKEILLTACKRGVLRDPVTTIGENVLNAMHDSSEHLPIREGSGPSSAERRGQSKILPMRAAFTNAMRRSVRVVLTLHLVYTSSTNSATELRHTN